MGIFKRVKALEDQNIALAKELASIRKQFAVIEKKLPDYEEAVARGVDDVWNKAVQSIIDFNPFKTGDEG